MITLAAANVYSQSVLTTPMTDYYTKWKVKLPEKQQYPAFGDSLLSFSNAASRSRKYVIAPFVPITYDTFIGVYEHNKRNPKQVVVVHKQRNPLLTVHGNVMYDLFYQSSVDTPVTQKDVYQHTVQTSLELTYKDNYPIRLNFSTRMGNSSLFRNLTDFNLQYTNRDFKNAMMKKARGWDAGKYAQLEELQKLRAQVEAKQLEINKLKKWKSDPALLQHIIEARERAYYAKIRDSLEALNKPDLRIPDLDISKRKRSDGKLSDLEEKGKKVNESADSVLQRFNDKYAAVDKKIDSLQQELAKLQGVYKQQENIYNIRKNALTDVLARSKNNKELADNLKAMNLPDSILPKGYKHLLAIRTVGVGRLLVDYSELTAKNISIFGAQAEYNPDYYVAFATGRVDYRFRDFIFNDNRTKQNLNLVRVGKGMRDGNNIILTYYTGRKQVYNFNTVSNNGTPSPTNLSQHIMGLSLEGRWQLDENNYIKGEIAKSSLPTYARPTGEHEDAGNGIFKLGDHSNEAYAISANSVLPKTGTRFSGVFKMMGANFQSFSLYTTGSSQTGWALKVDQPFFQQQLTFSAGIRKNDFTTSYQQTNYSSNTVFKSFQATFRRKKWPTLTLGYFPSSQLTKMSDTSYAENLYYNLSGTASHFYYYRGIMMSTMLTYTQFYNKQTDSSFLYFNSKNMVLSQTVFYGRFIFTAGGAIAVNPEYNLYTGEGGVQYKMLSWFELGGGMKYNYQTSFNLTQIGFSGNAKITIPKLGEIAVMAEKAFIPGMQKRLVSSNNGRITYIKTF